MILDVMTYPITNVNALYLTDSCTFLTNGKNGPELVNDHILQYLHSPHPSNSDDPTTFIKHIADMPYCSEKEQVMLLSVYI